MDITGRYDRLFAALVMDVGIRENYVAVGSGCGVVCATVGDGCVWLLVADVGCTN